MTIDYNLAKRLRDAGFPQPESIAENCDDKYVCCKHAGYFDSEGNRDDTPYLPDLSELIEACPKEIDGAVFDLCWLPKSDTEEGEWVAWYEAPNREMRELGVKTWEGLGPIPEIAVSELFLALKKK